MNNGIRIRRMVLGGGLLVLAACAASGCAAGTQAEAVPSRSVSLAQAVPAMLEDPDIGYVRNRNGSDLLAMQGPAGHRNEVRMTDVRMGTGGGFLLEPLEESPWTNGVGLEAEIDPAVLEY